MSKVSAWIHRHRGLAAFAAGVGLVLVALAVVGYFVLLDQRRSAQLLAATLSQALGREVQIDRVPSLSPSRVIMRGVRLPAEKGWPVDIAAESVEASGPLLSAARGDAAPVRIVVTRPTVTLAAGAPVAAGGTALEALRQGLGGLLASSAQIDLALTGGGLSVPGATGDGLAFDVTLQKGTGQTRAEIVLREGGGAPLTLRLDARGEGDRIRLTLDGQGALAPLGPWLPPSVVRAAGTTPVRLQLTLGVDPGDRLAGQGSVRLGDLAGVDLDVAMHDGILSTTRVRGGVDLGFASAVASQSAHPRGRIDLTDGEVTWTPGSGVLPGGRGTIQVAEAVLPPELAGTEVRLGGLDLRLTVEPGPGGVVVRGPLRVSRIAARGVDVAPMETQLRVTAGPDGTVGRIELAAIAARVLGASVRGQLTYEAAQGRADGRLDAETLPLDALLRRLDPDRLAATGQLRTGAARVSLLAVDVRGLGAGRVEADVQALTLRRPDGEAQVATARLRATLRPDGITVGLDAERVRSTLPAFDGAVPRLEGTAELARRGGTLGIARAAAVARDPEGREMLLADLAPRAGTGVTVAVRVPALERLAGLWPSVPRKVAGSATLTLDAPDASLAAFDGRLALRVPEAELLGGKVSLRDLSADVPIRRGAGGPTGQAAPGPLEVGELIGYGVVLHDVVGRARAVDERLALIDLQYAISSGEGRGGGEIGLGADGPFANLVLSGQGARIEEFVASYGIRGGTMTGLLRYDLTMRYRGGRLSADGRMSVPEGGTVTIELLDRLFQYTASDPSGVARRALANLRAFDYKSADATVRTGPSDLHVSLSLRGRERFGIFPPPVKEINVIDMPLAFLARQFPGQ